MRRGRSSDIPPQPPSNPSGGQVAIVPSALLDSADSVAIGIGKAAYNRNCRTGRGIWELSPRHRRFKQNPNRYYTETGTSCTTYSSDEAVAAESGTGAPWGDLNNAKALDPLYATCPLSADPLNVSRYLDITNLLPSTTLIGTMSSTAVKVSRKVVGDLLVTETVVQPRLSGSNLGSNLSTSYVLTATELESTFNLVSLPTTAQANAGNFQMRLQYTQETWDPAWSDPANWTIGISPASPHVYPYATAGSASHTSNFVVTLTWVGGGTAPSSVFVTLNGATTLTCVAPATGTGTTDNGLGGTDSGDLIATIAVPPDPGTVTSLGTSTLKTERLTVTSGVATRNVTMVSTATVPAAKMRAEHTLSASIYTPTNSTVYVNSVLARFCVSGTQTIKTGAQGIGYGEFETNKEVSVIWGQSEFKCPVSDATGALTSTWTGPNYAGLLDAGSCFIWQYGKWLWYANKTEGVYYREIGTTAFTPLSRDYSFQGNASLSSTYRTTRTWDAVTNTIVITEDLNEIDWVSTAIVDGAVELTGNTDDTGLDGTFVFESTWATAENWTEAAQFEIELIPGVGASEFYADNRKISINWESAPATYTWQEIETKQFVTGSHDVGNAKKTLIGRLKGLVAHGAAINVKGIRFTTTSWIDQNNPNEVFATIKPIRFGGAHLGATSSTDRVWDSGGTGTEIEYACRYKKISTSEVSGADVAKAPASLSIGAKYQSYSTYRGGRTEIRSSFVNQAPFIEDTSGSPNIVIEFMRKDATGVWRSLGTKGNTGTQSYFDDYEEWEMSTLPAVTDFSTDVDSGIFGEVTGIICGCAWKGSNIYAHTNGKIYMSASNDGKDVLWDGIVETNEVIIGSPKTAARTDTLADNTVDPALALVPCENLYAITAREVYVFVSDDGTPATSSFPRKIAGAMGVVGTLAACSWKDAALYATMDGLTIVKKSSASGEQPDVLEVITKEIRQTWAWLLGSSPSTTIVRTHLNDIWVLNQSRALWFREGEHFVPIEWADARVAVDAAVSPDYGVIVQWSNGHVSRMQEVVTDGASDTGGTNGLGVTWQYTTGQAENESTISRITATTIGDTTVTLVSDTGENEVVASSTAEDTLRLPVEHHSALTRLNRSKLAVEVTGQNDAKLKSLFLIQSARSRSRTPDY